MATSTRFTHTHALDTARAGGVDLVVCDPAPLMTAVYSVQYFADDSLLDQALVSDRIRRPADLVPAGPAVASRRFPP